MYGRRAEQDNGLLGCCRGSAAKRRIVGLCTGLLPAAVAAVATNIAELVDIARETVMVSLRLGLHAKQRSSQIDQTSGSWSIALSGADIGETRSTIDRYHHDRVSSFPLHWKI